MYKIGILRTNFLQVWTREVAHVDSERRWYQTGFSGKWPRYFELQILWNEQLRERYFGFHGAFYEFESFILIFLDRALSTAEISADYQLNVSIFTFFLNYAKWKSSEYYKYLFIMNELDLKSTFLNKDQREISKIKQYTYVYLYWLYIYKIICKVWTFESFNKFN